MLVDFVNNFHIKSNALALLVCSTATPTRKQVFMSLAVMNDA